MNKDDSFAMPVSEEVAARKEPNRPKSKSSAQVENVVCQPTGSQRSGALKLDGSRPYRIVVRFSKEEKESVGIQAKNARMPVSSFVRLTVLKLPGLDPDRNKLLHKIHFELNRQGNNLNQIAKHLNAKTATPEQGDSMLAILGRSLLSAHRAVRQVMTEGRRYEE